MGGGRIAIHHIDLSVSIFIYVFRFIIFPTKLRCTACFILSLFQAINVICLLFVFIYSICARERERERVSVCNTCFASFCKYYFLFTLFCVCVWGQSCTLVRCLLPFVPFTIVIFQYRAFIGAHCFFTAFCSLRTSAPFYRQFCYYFLECMLFNHNKGILLWCFRVYLFIC